MSVPKQLDLPMITWPSTLRIYNGRIILKRLNRECFVVVAIAQQSVVLTISSPN